MSTSNGCIILDETTGEKFGPFKDAGYITAVQFSSDKKKILTVSLGKNIATLWDIKSLKPLYKFEHNSSDLAIAFFSYQQAEYVLTGSFDGIAKVWSLQTGSLIQTIEHGDPILTMCATDEYIMARSLKIEKIWPFINFKMLSFSQFILSIKLQRCLETKTPMWLSRKWRKTFGTLPNVLKTKFQKYVIKRKKRIK